VKPWGRDFRAKKGQSQKDDKRERTEKPRKGKERGKTRKKKKSLAKPSRGLGTQTLKKKIWRGVWKGGRNSKGGKRKEKGGDSRGRGKEKPRSTVSSRKNTNGLGEEKKPVGEKAKKAPLNRREKN